jgi:phosphate transport system ATP-binding protein
MRQAARVFHFTAFMYLGELIELGGNHQVFPMPNDRRAQDDIIGRFD